MKAEVLAEAKLRIDEGGGQALSARGIAEAVGISVGTVYNLFGHLDGVVRAVNLMNMQELYVRLTEAVDGAGEEAEQRLLAMAETYLDYALDSPQRWDTMFRYEAETPPEDHLAKAEDALFALLRRAAGDEETDDTLSALWAAVHGVVELAIGRRATLGRDKPHDHVRLIVKAGLRGVQKLREEGQL